MMRLESCLSLIHISFIAPNMNKGLNTRERNDVLPEHNEGQALIPQILTNRADYFLTTCRDLAELGYEDVYKRQAMSPSNWWR